MHRFPRLFCRRISVALSWLVLAAFHAAGQSPNYPYVLRNFAGTFPLGDGGPATQALLSGPVAVVAASDASLYVLDAGNYRIRRIAPGGTISTMAQLSVLATDMKLGKDGSFYVAAPGLVFKVSPAGVAATLAGNGTQGFAGDGGPAVNSLVGAISGIALDPAGNVFFADGSRIREITLDGKIQTVAGTGTSGYDGDNKPAVSAQLNVPTALAFDSSNNLYIADGFNYRVRKVSGGTITTIAGNGSIGQPVNGPALATPIGVPHAVAIDGAGSVFVADVSFSAILKIGTDGTLAQVAGTQTFGYADGPANTTYLSNPLGLALDGSGNIFIADTGSNRIRLLNNGSVLTIAGRLHYAGDGAAATSALLNNPLDTAIDAPGNVYILDSANFRIREVTPDGKIITFAGTGVPGTPAEGAQAASTALPQLYAMSMDGLGNLYLAASQKIYQISAAGVITTFAGIPGAAGGSGDGGLAIKAGFNVVVSLAADSAGNVYVGDCCIPRVRKISAADGTISAFAGTATPGYAGDGGPATSAKLGGPVTLAVDRSGNVYIGDGANNVVRIVDQSGIISTVVGNGTKGNPIDGAAAKSSPLTAAAGVVADASGNLYIMSANGSIYRVDIAGRIRVVSGGGAAVASDGLLANTTGGFGGKGIQVDVNNDLYAAVPAPGMVLKLVQDSPSGLTIADGNNQTAPVGSTLPKPLKVTVNGRGGVAVPGITINFSIAGGVATLSAASVQTDSTGSASAGVTLGSAGSVVITAAIAGSGLASVRFTAVAFNGNSNCTLGLPVITSVKSLSDFGGLPVFGAGSWLEVKGSNLASNPRLWAGGDFKGADAPTSLDGSSVGVNGIPAFVEYISPAQINVQAPADPATGAVQVTATNCAGTSAPVTLQKVLLAPGMLAPASFNAGGRQYVAALFPDGVTFVGNTGLIAGVPSRPAKPGETITMYGVGFGPVTPPVAPGVVVGGPNSIPNLAINFGLTAAAISYAGLAPNNIGLYQFNIMVPNLPDGDYQINVNVGGAQLAQTVYLTVHQ